MYVYLFLIPALLIFLMFLPIVLELKFSFNLLTNTGVISIYVFKLNIIHYIFEIKGNTISLKKKDELIEKKIEFDSPEFDFYKYFIKEVKDKLRLRFLDVSYNIGCNDAFLTSIICGYVNTICLIFYSLVKNQKPTASLGLCNITSYNKREAVFAADLNISISLFDLVYSLILSVILTKKLSKKTA